MNLRLVVGGLLTRDAVLGRLLLNYADRLQHGHLGQGTRTATCFIVPSWTVDARPSAPLGSELFTVEVHVSRDDPRGHRSFEVVLQLLHAALIDDARGLITVRSLGTSPGVMASGLDTVFKVGTWEIAPASSQHPGMAQRRLVPWPCCSQLATAGSLAPDFGAASMN